MAFAFGDSYLKLPPISQESSVEIVGEDSKRNLGIVREHGLVRLPPIVRLDSLRSTSTSAQRFRNETQTVASTENTEAAMSTSPMNMANKMESLRLQGRSKKLEKDNNKSEDEMKLIMEAAAKETNEDETSLFDSENVSHEKGKASRKRLSSSSALLSQTSNDEFLPLHRDSLLPRRGSSTFQPTKLTRSRRLAKSSPELSNRKKNLRLLPDGNVSERSMSPLATGFMPIVRSNLSTRPQLAVQDIDGSKLNSQVQNNAKIEEKTKEYGGKRRNYGNQRWKTDVANLPQSTPSSPVCSESANSGIKQKGRKSLNDITDAEQFVDRRRPSLKKQNLVYDADVDELKIEGKSCSQSERELQRGGALTESNVDMLNPPKNEEKRHSLYDLQQILTLLQKEDLKRQASNTALSSRNASYASEREPGESVYDLREFLLMAAVEASNAGQLKKTTTNKVSAINSQTSSSSHVVPPGREEDDRKGSVYDLMEFLSLGNISETGSGSTSENSSRSTSPRILLSPRANSSSNDLLSVANRGEESRRTSTYDLMEFLSLPRSGDNSRPDSGPSSPALHKEGPSVAESDISDSGTDKVKEKRSLSVYDLEEFLSMTSDIPLLTRVTPWDEEQITNRSKTVSNSEEGAKRDLQQPRGSVYDLREILSKLQQENEKRGESTNDLSEMLFHFQREAEETGQSSPTLSTNSSEKCTAASFPVTKTAGSSGYSTGSDLAPSTNTSTATDATENSRQMSGYEFLSLSAGQQNPSPTNQRQFSSASLLRRKFSGVSQSGVSILVTDESNRSVDSEFYEDVFLPVPGTEPSGASADPSRKRSSIYDLREFLSILNADESPLRRRLSSVSSASSKFSESESESNSAQTTGALKLACSSQGKENSSRPQLTPRQDSGGSLSLYDLSEFLSLLNTDESPLRRRLSSTMSSQGEKGARTPVLSRSDSEKGLYSLEEILAAMNELEQRNSSKSMSGEIEGNIGEEISIQVPNLPPKVDTTNAQSLPPRKLLHPQRLLKSVPETSEVRNTHSNSL